MFDQQSPDDTNIPGSDSSFTGDVVNENSIGDGSSDQGIEPGEEKRDDEFRNGDAYPKSKETPGKEEILDEENTHHTARPDHGLVEEGPAPDA